MMMKEYEDVEKLLLYKRKLHMNAHHVSLNVGNKKKYNNFIPGFTRSAIKYLVPSTETFQNSQSDHFILFTLV